MWYEAAEDVRSYTIADQFMLGPNLVVAPVLEDGVRVRKVFLPDGMWVD